ncbi:MAG: MBL fold metallo-hydrolase [Betaproteobacteria bacterium]
MRFASLGSGSRGNSLVVDAGDTRLLVDCGFSTKSMLARLSRLAIDPGGIDALLVTHEHGDHIAGAFKFSSRFGIPVYLSSGTHQAASRQGSIVSEIRLIDSHLPFSIGSLEIQPFPVPHDAREPVQYVINNGNHRLGVLTDTGSITAHVIEMLRQCDALVLECNHDLGMLAESVYPEVLKRRISGSLGHLDNDQAVSLLQRIETKKLQHIVAAHLSEQNNRPELVVRALASVLNCSEDWIGVACQERGFDWRQLA